MSWLPKQKVVLPIDFSDSSADALQTALQLVAKPSDLHVVHVLIPMEFLSPGTMTGSFDESDREKLVREQLANFLQANHASECNSAVRLGDPSLDVAEYATEVHADLIVIPSHGYHGMKRFFFGSVAEGVIRHADCAVLVLRRRDAE